jgi:uncharacterized protein YoxC|tara:strand:- start:268 stop:519 length:252 start_codon:yes stop_codon:yes gene_type:complete
MEVGQMEILIAHWHQILFIVGIIVVAVRLESEVKNLRKDVDEIQKRDTYVETVRLRAEMDVQAKQTSALWDFCNKLREKFNGH